MTSKFATAINCMDGRVQVPVIEYMRKTYHADYVDMITEAGPNKILAENSDKAKVESIKARARISVERHGSRLIAVVGHHDCAGNPANAETQLRHIRAAMKTVDSWSLKVEVTGIWVDANWSTHAVQ